MEGPKSIRRYMKFNVFFLKLAGLWTENRRFSKFDWAYFFAVNILSIGTFNFCLVVYIAVHLSEFKLVASSAHLAMIFVMPSVKAYFFVRNWDLIHDLVTQLDSESFQPKNLRQQNQLDPTLRAVNIILFLYVAISCGLTSMWILIPVLTAGSERALPFLLWYPFDWRESFKYELAIFHQAFGIVNISIVNLNLDVLTYSLCVFIGSECDIISDTMRNIVEFSRENLRIRGIGIGSSEVVSEMERILVECVHHHRTVLRFAEKTNLFLNYLIFMQFASSLLATCLTLFMLTIVSPMSTEFLTIAFYQSGVFVELMMYCWFGNEVTIKVPTIGVEFLLVCMYQVRIFIQLLFYCIFGHETITNLSFKSRNISTALYESPWMDCSATFKRNLLFFTLRTQTPIRLLAVDFFELSLSTFMAIMRISWSVFAMIRQVVEK